MKREQRLHHDADFALLREQGRNYSNRVVAIYVLANGQNGSRIGVAAGKRLGNAVVRNRAKRLLREAINRRLSQIKPGTDLLLVARNAIIGKGLTDIAAAVDSLLAKSQLIIQENQVLL